MKKKLTLNKTTLVNLKVKRQTSSPYTGNRFIRILFLPVTLFLGAIGWSFYWIGLRAKPSKKENNSEIQGVDILVAEKQTEG